MSSGSGYVYYFDYAPFVGHNGATNWLRKSKYKSWSGSDAITTTTPRVSYPRYLKLSGLTREDARKQRLLSKLSKPQLPPQALTTSIVVHKDGAAIVSDASGNQQTYVGINTWDVPYYYDVSQEYKVIDKLRDKLYGSGFNPAVFLAEGRQTLDMISDRAQRIGSALYFLRKRSLNGVLDALGIQARRGVTRDWKGTRRSLSSLWLEVQYGWLPLLKDVEAGAQWLAEANQERRPGPIRARRAWFGGEFAGDSGENSGLCWSRAIVYYQLQYVLYGTADSVATPNLATLATVAWEKLPYSFVADWFVPIGGYLEALRTARSISATVVKSLKRTTTFAGPIKSMYTAFPTVVQVGGDPFDELVSFSRDVSQEINVPRPSANIEQMVEYRSWRHAANAVALLSQRNWKPLADAWAARPRATT